ncbi:putative Zn(2)-C6 fungal-type domain-containing protein [Seiridium unicorne]|uniref:Zn(2)-C6 fungal-type domain-containing protein n=1 Tax=Seiridium unicorne TaxID=138068 RepID=A0ABR2V0E6_9PEZI
MSSIIDEKAVAMDAESRKAALKGLSEAVNTNDIASIEALFATKQLNSSDATKELKHFGWGQRFSQREGSTNVLKCMLEKGGNPNAIDIRRVPSLDKLKLLFEHGFDIKGQGHLVLEDVVDSRETLGWLIDHGVDINCPDSSRTTRGVECYKGEFDHSLGVLNNAAARGDIAMFDYLISRGADLSRSRALHHASRCRDPTKTEAMILHLINNYGLDVDEVKDEGLRNITFTYNRVLDTGTPLNCAVVHRNMAALTTLLKQGANPNSGPNGRQSYEAPANTAIMPNNRRPWVEALEPLFKAGADPSGTLIQAVESDDIEAAKICLKYGGELAEVFEVEGEKIEDDTNSDNETPDIDFISDEMRMLFQEWKQSNTRHRTLPQRVKVHACDVCYRKRIKCDGQKPVCSHCVLYHAACTFDAPHRKAPGRRQKPSNAAHDLQARVEILEASLNQALQKIHELESKDEAIAATFGPSSSSGIQADLSNLEKTQSHNGFLELPPLHEVLSATQNYLATFNSVIPLFNPDKLLRTVNQWYASENQGDYTTWAAINTVLALAHREVPSGEATSSKNAAKYIRNAQSVLADVVMGDAKLLTVQVLVGMTMIFQGVQDLKPAAMLIAIALRLAPGA